MDLTIVLEQRFDRTPDGRVWTATGYAHAFWDRYLEVFARVRVVARVREVPGVQPGWMRVDGQRVEVVPVHYYVGPAGYLRGRRRVGAQVRAAVQWPGAVILRSGVLGGIASRYLAALGRPYAMEIVGDPYEVFAPGVLAHPARRYFRWRFTRDMKRQCAGAGLAVYVTRRTLQARYPCPAGMVGVSDVELPPEALVTAPRAPRELRDGVLEILFVGSLEQLYKGPDVLVAAVERCARGGADVRLTVVGDGRYRGQLEAMAAEAGVGGRVRFLGSLPGGAAVRERMDAADLFVLPSRTEGMPRALIEAMARGLPCIGSRVGGIPELLAEPDMVPPGDVDALAAKIQEVANDAGLRAAMSARSLTVAREYQDHLLNEQRRQFLRSVRELTERAAGAAR